VHGIRKVCIRCFCDFAQAFDGVNHELLLYKLEYYGMQGKILDWFKSYLVNRKQRVVLKSSKTHNFSSNWETVKHGVPHGCVLGSLLLNIYFNDFPIKN
jgi:uncharacterized membrane protein